MDHARCSELLPAMERGELDAPTVAAVRHHLEGCEDCSLELAGMRVFHAVRLDPMTAAERDLLHQAIAREVETPGAQQTVVAPGRSSFWTRVAPALAGVGVLAVVLTAAVFLNAQSGSDRGSATFGAEGDGAGGDTAETAGGAADQAAPAAEELADADVQWDGYIGEVTQARLSRSLQRRDFSYVASTASESIGQERADDRIVAKNGAAAATNLMALQARAGGRTAEQIGTCAQAVTDAVPYETLPTYAAIAKLDGRRVLLMGFRWAEAGQRDLDEFMLWAWPIGDCAVPVFYGADTPRD